MEIISKDISNFWIIMKWKIRDLLFYKITVQVIMNNCEILSWDTYMCEFYNY